MCLYIYTYIYIYILLLLLPPRLSRSLLTKGLCRPSRMEQRRSPGAQQGKQIEHYILSLVDLVPLDLLRRLPVVDSLADVVATHRLRPELGSFGHVKLGIRVVRQVRELLHRLTFARVNDFSVISCEVIDVEELVKVEGLGLYELRQASEVVVVVRALNELDLFHQLLARLIFRQHARDRLFHDPLGPLLNHVLECVGLEAARVARVMAVQLLEALLTGEEGIVNVDNDADVVLENFVQDKVRSVLAADDRRHHNCDAADGHALRIEQVVSLALVVNGRVDGLRLGLRHHAGGAEVAVDDVVRHDRQSVADVGVELDPSEFFLRLEFLRFIVLEVDHAVGLDLVFLFIFKE